MKDRSRMKLLVISMLYEPDCVGIAAIASDMCAGLAERGHDVTVYTTYPYYPEWQRKTDDDVWRIREEELSDVHVRRHGLFVPRHPSRLVPRLMHELSFTLSLTRSLFHRRQFDAVMVFCPLLGSVAFAALRKLFRREPLWVNVQDIPAEAGRATGINRSRFMHQFGSLAQKCLFRCGETWSSISPEMVGTLTKLSSDQTTIHLCPNWLTASLSQRIAKLPRRIGRVPEGPLKLLYCGTIGRKQALVQLCEAMRQSDLDFRFKIHGEGGEAAAVARWVQGAQDARFQFGTLLPEEDFVREIHAADWFVISETHGAGSSFLPSKLIPSISIGTPILAVADASGPLGNEMRKHELGVHVEWSEIAELSNKLRRFDEAPDRFIQLQENCIARASSYARQPAIERMEELIARCIGT